MKYGLFSPPSLVSTAHIQDFAQVAEDGDQLVLGAGCTLWQLRSHPLVTERYPALAAACSTVATPTIQAMGTLGGNLALDTRCLWYNQSTFWRGALGGCLKCEGEICHVAPKGTGCYAAHSADTVPVLMLYGAVVEVVSATGQRRLPLAEIYADDGIHFLRLEKGELLSRIFLPPPGDAVVVHRKLRLRGSIDYPLLLTAVRVERDSEQRACGGRIVLSALGPMPLEIEGADLALREGDPDIAAEIAWKQAAPLSTHLPASTWRKRMVRVEVQRALAEAGMGQP
jgi:4-hydroxybenzoyl-CoA reductase subunit beta